MNKVKHLRLAPKFTRHERDLVAWHAAHRRQEMRRALLGSVAAGAATVALCLLALMVAS
jgi:hypothetical protein